MNENVVLVDRQDNKLGLMEKMKAHEEGLLHRAFSVFLFNEKGQTLLQQRADHKYHSGGLWTNTCCSHPRDGESYYEGAKRRLVEEMGIQTSDLKKAFHFIYKAALDNDLTEHELDHVFVGYYDKDPAINPDEVKSFKWMTIEEVSRDIQNHPEKYTEWFKIIFHEYQSKIETL